MTTIGKAAIAVILSAGAAFAQPANVNINVEFEQLYVDRITEVQVVGGGLHQFPDPFTAPDLAEPALAISAALAGLGYPPGTVATVQSTSAIGTDETFVEVVDASHNPIDDPTVVIGDPDDYLTWIAISDVDVQVDVHQTATSYTFHRLVVAIAPPCGDGTVQVGETCDDGNTDDGDCCSSTCQYDVAGSACDDGVVCTAADACDGAGACQPGGAATTCVASWAKASLIIKEDKPGKEKLIAKVSGVRPWCRAISAIRPRAVPPTTSVFSTMPTISSLRSPSTVPVQTAPGNPAGRRARARAGSIKTRGRRRTA